jgi:glycosyltransferase involved in cell wall biosynthesis
MSIVVATYNWPEALRLCLESLALQTDQHFEVTIADDGSGPATKELIDKFIQGSPFSIQHLWQEDQGFRKTIILNQAIKAAQGDYLIFLDGDCIVQPDFVQRHRQLAEHG